MLDRAQFEPALIHPRGSHAARMLAMFQAVIGVFYLAVVVAMFVGTYASQPRE